MFLQNRQSWAKKITIYFIITKIVKKKDIVFKKILIMLYNFV